MSTFLLILSLALIIACVALVFVFLKQAGRIKDLENKLNQAGQEASSSKRSLESVQRDHESTMNNLRSKADIELAEVQKDLSVARTELEACIKASAEKEKQIQDMTSKIEAAEATAKRAREAEDKLSTFQREAANLRSECSQAHKRVEAAESAARDKQIQFERVEATLEAKDNALTLKQQESANLARELDEKRTEISELVIERDKLLSMEAALKEKLSEVEESFKSSERDRQRINDEFTECRLDLAETKDKLSRIKQMFDEQAAAGENDMEQIQRLRDQLLDVQGQLSRKEAALADLEQVHADATRETSYEAHKHIEWTLNHFDPKAITFKFNNLGAKVFLVDVQTSVPQLRYEFETGRELPRGKDFESRIKLAIKKSEQRNMEEIPSEFDMTVFYALNIYPIHFKIRPREGQKIERIKDEEGDS